MQEMIDLVQDELDISLNDGPLLPGGGISCIVASQQLDDAQITRQLVVTVENAQNVPVVDRVDVCDPYVEITVMVQHIQHKYNKLDTSME